LRARGTMRAVAARCHAWSAAPLLAPLLAPPDAGAPVAGAIHPLRAAHATLGDAIAERLEVGDVAGALGRLTDALRALVAAAPAIPAHVRRAGQALTGTLDRTLGAESGAALGDTSGAMVGGAMRRGAPVRRAAAASGRTPRHLERQFRALAGVTPKAYARHARFEQVRDRLWAEPQTSLSALAAECGYADQAHLTREFGAYAGVPPARWAAGIARTRALLHGGADPARQVAFLQDD
ncbi:MAG TPA: helix-turn-helix domain-containing protein, partial [Gemmatirosa sp.]